MPRWIWLASWVVLTPDVRILIGICPLNRKDSGPVIRNLELSGFGCVVYAEQELLWTESSVREWVSGFIRRACPIWPLHREVLWTNTGGPQTGRSVLYSTQAATESCGISKERRHISADRPVYNVVDHWRPALAGRFHEQNSKRVVA